MTQRASIERLYTIAEFENMPEFGERYELIDGRLVKKPMPGFEHGVIADTLRDAIRDFDKQKKLGFAHREVSINLGKGENSPIPDLSYWKSDRGIKITEKAAPLPDLAVEVLSPGDTVSPSALKSAMVKVKKLVNAGVPIVWVINSRLRTVEVYHAHQTAPVAHLGLNDKLEGENVIPGFELEIKDLFAE